MTMKVKRCVVTKNYPIYYKITKHRSLSSLYYMPSLYRSLSL
jgi:hypothetical protein